MSGGRMLRAICGARRAGRKTHAFAPFSWPAGIADSRIGMPCLRTAKSVYCSCPSNAPEGLRNSLTTARDKLVAYFSVYSDSREGEGER